MRPQGGADSNRRPPLLSFAQNSPAAAEAMRPAFWADSHRRLPLHTFAVPIFIAKAIHFILLKPLAGLSTLQAIQIPNLQLIHPPASPRTQRQTSSWKRPTGTGNLHPARAPHPQFRRTTDDFCASNSPSRSTIVTKPDMPNAKLALAQKGLDHSKSLKLPERKLGPLDPKRLRL